MRSKPKPELATDFVVKLKAVGHLLENGENVSSAFVGIPKWLFELSPNSISALGMLICHSASLYAYRGKVQRSLLESLLWPSVPEAKQLRRVFGLEYLFLFHGNGYLRQAALEKIAGPLNSPFIAASIVLRMNDWVPAVRQAAQSCAQRTFPATSPFVLASAARSLLADMAAWRRWGPNDGSLRAMLLRDEVCNLIATEMLLSSASSDAVTFRHLVFNPAMDKHLESLAKSAVTPTVRALAAKALLSGQAKWQVGWCKASHDRYERSPRLMRAFESRAISMHSNLSSILPRLAEDPSKLVRVTLLDHLILTKAADPAAAQIAESFLHSDVRPLKERAEFIMGKPASGAWATTEADEQLTAYIAAQFLALGNQ
jgi:hypothetical protein